MGKSVNWGNIDLSINEDTFGDINVIRGITTSWLIIDALKYQTDKPNTIK